MTDELKIIHYPHPALRHKSKPLRKVDAWLRQAVACMFDRMYEAKGVGLAANQVDLPYRLFIANVTGDPEIKEEEQVFINPVVSLPKGSEEGEEGCLSLPGIHMDVTRPEKVRIEAYTLSGEVVAAELEGFPARVVQHETDHLDGVLFIDRLSETARMSVKEELEEFQINFAGQRERGEIPGDEVIVKRLRILEQERT